MPARRREPEDDVRTRLAQRLKALRTERGMSQEEAAHASKISRVFLGSIERGDQSPTLEIIHRLAQGLGVGLEELLAPVGGARSVPVSPRRAFVERMAAYASDATDADLARFERLARAYFGHAVAKKAVDGRPKVRPTGFERTKRTKAK